MKTAPVVKPRPNLLSPRQTEAGYTLPFSEVQINRSRSASFEHRQGNQNERPCSITISYSRPASNTI